MEDSKNSSEQLYKIMWAAEGDNIIWNMRKESHDNTCLQIAQLLNCYINLSSWAKSYESLYRRWLNNNNTAIYDINSSINKEMIEANLEFNRHHPFNLYYWFDVDRSVYEDYQWVLSPISGEKLKRLPPPFNQNNRLISQRDMLAFPQA